jgi:hypothetical protein
MPWTRDFAPALEAVADELLEMSRPDPNGIVAGDSVGKNSDREVGSMMALLRSGGSTSPEEWL